MDSKNQMQKREIKFRAWVIGMSQMFYHEEINYGHVLDYKEPHDDINLMQFTGLHDKNSKEIYEGDIIRSHGHNYIVGYSECTFDITNTTDADDTFYLFQEWYQDCIIIGNIYENPELLKP